jgi:predicted dehydrogenase
VIVATPPALHAEMVHAAVARALPVLVEKPLTLELREAQALRDFVAERAGTVMVDHTHLFHPAYRALKRALPGLGAIRAVASVAGNEGPFRRDVPVLWDWGAHDVAFCLDLLGALPRELRAAIVASRETPEGVGQVVEIRAAFPGEVSAVLKFGNILAKARRLSVYLDEAVLVYDDVAPYKLMRHPPAQPHEAPVEPGEPLPFEAGMPLSCAVAEFASAARAADASLGSLDLGLEVVRVLERCEAALADT